MKLQNIIEFPNLFSGFVVKVEKTAFSLFGLDVYWYGIIITAAIILGVTYGVKSAPKVGLKPESVFSLAFWGILGGIVGARAYYVIFSGRWYTFYEAVFGIRDGGLAIYGGLIGALLTVTLVAKKSKIKFAPFADLIGLGFLIGHGIGRWGNFFNQEAFGAPTAINLPWGMTGNIIQQAPEVIEAQQKLGVLGYALVHPCFLYESLWTLIGFAVLHFYMKKYRSFDGEIFLLYVFWYGLGRAFIESLRLDSLMVGGLRVSQVLAIASAVFAMGLFVYFKKNAAKKSLVMFKDTDESRLLVAQHDYKVKLEREKEKAVISYKRAYREHNDPFAESVVDDEKDNS